MLSAALRVALALLAGTVLLLRPNRYAKLPPGPPGLPLLGNLLQLPNNFMYIKLHGWSKLYGPIFSFNAGGQRVVVLNSAKTAGDVLDRLSAHSSNRPAWIKLDQFLCRGNNMVGLPLGETFRRLRKAVHEVLNIRNVDGFRSMQEEEAIVMIRGLLAYPNVKLVKHFHRASASIVWRALYGGVPLDLNGRDPTQRIEELSAYSFRSALPGKSLMDIFPPFRHLYANSKWLRRYLDEWHLESTVIFEDLYHGAKDASALGVPCVSNNLSRLPEEYGISETARAWTSGVLFSAGQDTTATTLRFFVLAMLLHPEVMRQAQAELDAVVGDRMPTFEDKDRLPYISAIVKEVARWHPAVPAGLPHAAADDFEYDGYVIPRGTWIIDNIWSQTRDPALYDDPEEFRPSRFLDSEGRIKPGAPIRTMTAFACLLWAFEFCSREGELAPNDVGLVDNFLTVQPAPFEVDLVPRFKDLNIRLGHAGTHSV
ncbi:cytochrome P450 [Calocera viscosa TUFC12733]|uniref:Cytochrome P450 n=1 Tax=Calocera viscosa (strain TUFC12733) TaxID=1330018 RepID=A0A167IXJ9_CALVF|nr:cytochrome P450 [Calocera viscosa TUFC12733]